MAELLWGQVYFHDAYAGVLKQEPGERCSFTYDASYLASGRQAIAWTLPVRGEPHISQGGLHPFFDNLVAEGWLEEAQTRLLGKRRASRFELLLAFGQDCAGAVWVQDPSPAGIEPSRMDLSDPKQLAVLAGRASLSGIQPKVALVERNGKFHPVQGSVLSSHIAKFSSSRHPDLVMNEYLTTGACKALLPKDTVVDLTIAGVEGFAEQALIIRRFDRAAGGGRIHFEEFNQLLGRLSGGKYEGSHKEMADFLRQAPGCLPTEIYRLLLRIWAGLLLGNTDMHLKNFAIFHDSGGFGLTPSYDQVAAALYDYQTVALGIGGAEGLSWPRLKAKSLIRLGQEFGLSVDAMAMGFGHLSKHKDAALDAVAEAEFGTKKLKDDIIQLVRKRWNGTFSLIGPALLKKR